MLTVLPTLTHLYALGAVAAQTAVMFEKELGQEGGIDRIALRSRRVERFAKVVQT